MTEVTRPLSVCSGSAAAKRAAQRRLDAMTRGECTADELVWAVTAGSGGASDAAWEALSLLDQYHRRGKLETGLFLSLKPRIEHRVLGVAGPADESVTRPVAAIVPTVEAATLQPGAMLGGRYRLQSLLGRGGMGTVFEAVDQYQADASTTGQHVAIKILHTQVSDRPDLLAELRREFQHSQALSHPNIVRVHEMDRDGDLAFFTMELLRGELLSDVLRGHQPQALPRVHALAIIRDVGAALAHAHSRDVVHGDLKPQNIFITADGTVRVLDFGAAYTLMREPWISEAGMPVRHAVATPGYSSCQLLEGQHPDARDDLYAFACVAYELLDGEHPFQHFSALEARSKRMRPRRPAGLRRDQWQALRAGLAWERQHRPADVMDWLRRLDLHAAAERLPLLPELMIVPIPPPRWSSGACVVLAAAVLALTLAAAWLAMAR